MRVLNSKEKAVIKRTIMMSVIIGFIVSSLVLILKRNLVYSIASFFITNLLIYLYLYFKKSLDKSDRIKKIEGIFPDFLQLMSSNLRAGMTIDKAILLSSRPEFSPLDVEILNTGKYITTGKDIEIALIELGGRIGSDKIKKTIKLIISGIKSGGDLAVLLEETSASMRQREFIEKKAYSNVVMYVIFIFLVVSIFAPALFSLSNVLVEVLTNILSNIPPMQSSINLPFTLSKISISIQFTRYFSLMFIIVIDILASMVLGLVSKGEEREGLKFLPAILIISISVFYVSRIFVANFLKGLL